MNKLIFLILLSGCSSALDMPAPTLAYCNVKPVEHWCHDDAGAAVCCEVNDGG